MSEVARAARPCRDRGTRRPVICGHSRPTHRKHGRDGRVTNDVDYPFMIVTARQLEDLHKSNGGNGRVTLPYRARLTPLAADFVRARKLTVGYSEVATPATTTGETPMLTASTA